MFTVAELAVDLGVSKSTIFRQARSGVIPSTRVAGCIRFDPQAVAEWVERAGCREKKKKEGR